MFLNHFEITVPRGTLTDEFCRDIDQLLVGILGWGEGKTHRFPHQIQGYPVVARFYKINKDQFGVINEHENFQRAGHDDHVGFHIESVPTLERILAQIKELAARDDRVEFMNLPGGEFASFQEGKIVSTGFYVRYLLPFFFDLQTKYEATAEAEEQATVLA